MNREKSNENLADLRHFNEKYLPQIEKSLREFLPVSPPKVEKEFNEAIEFTLFSDEKRLFPLLTLLGAKLFGGKAETLLPTAAAIEFINKSSLIFEDLSFVKKDANQREKKESLAEKFGDSLAITVAVALLNTSYSLVFVNYIGMPERAMQAHQEIVECVSAEGLVGGFAIDLKNSKDFAENDLHQDSSRSLKISALMRLALRVGAILAGADYLDQANLSRLASFFGDIYQLSGDFQKDKEIEFSQTEISGTNQINSLVEQTQRFLIENFPSNEARSCLIQLTEYLAESR